MIGMGAALTAEYEDRAALQEAKEILDRTDVFYSLDNVDLAYDDAKLLLKGLLDLGWLVLPPTLSSDGRNCNFYLVAWWNEINIIAFSGAYAEEDDTDIFVQLVERLEPQQKVVIITVDDKQKKRLENDTNIGPELASPNPRVFIVTAIDDTAKEWAGKGNVCSFKTLAGASEFIENRSLIQSIAAHSVELTGPAMATDLDIGVPVSASQILLGARGVPAATGASL